MTRERALELARQTWGPTYRVHHIYDTIADAILAAVAEERESCATIAQREADNNSSNPGSSAAACIADQIRERGNPLKVGA